VTRHWENSARTRNTHMLLESAHVADSTGHPGGAPHGSTAPHSRREHGEFQAIRPHRLAWQLASA
jgi:hypothetical protein